jgi:phage baseplate assembly protein W
VAYGLKKISPLDLRPSTAIGVKIPFSTKNVFTSVYTTKEQTKYNLINFLLTDRRETPMVPNFGAGIRSLLFEQITQDSMDRMEAYIRSSVEANFPNVLISTLGVIPNEDESYVTINFGYVLRNSNQEDEITIKIEA